jgi:hypothetical protein
MHRNHFTRELEDLQLRRLPQQIREERRIAGQQMKLWKGKSPRSPQGLAARIEKVSA